MKLIAIMLLLGMLITGSTLNTNAQVAFSEGVVLYKADTVERLVPDPGQHWIGQMKIYKKGRLARQEIISVNSGNLSDTIRMTQIRNEKGIYTCLSSNSGVEKMAILSTYEEEKQDRAERASKGHLPTYTVEKTGQRVQLLGLTAERVHLKNSTDKPVEALVSTAIEAPVALFFETLSQVEGTALQFEDRDDKWLIRYTATAIEARTLPAQLFEVAPEFMIISMKQMQEMGKPTK